MIEFRVYGTPVPQGSKGIMRGRLVSTNDADLRRWRATVEQTAREHYTGEPLTGPVRLTAAFYFARPKYHYRTGKHAHELRADAPVWHDKKPDHDKLLRAVCDALTDAGVWRDDSQVAMSHPSKRYAPDGRTEGVVIRVSPLQLTE
ncbi:RusA family crossover junction endodeoxyribonuclease [uncultured Aeromicrobium sp.]|uniref:RusA family crossover junction endodeoxyribonuclease n=1 Tax=uncultured Aeromicrobium sp. TaxID=337820 RepID=UPI0025F78508|nr:RusA family crossover junction endodeoxyribonuclease [uncultured Aeromicrobium sp.]